MPIQVDIDRVGGAPESFGAGDLTRNRRLTLDPFARHKTSGDRLRGHEFCAVRRFGGSGKSTVARQELRIEHFGERYVHGVVGTQVVSKFPHTIQKGLMRVALQIQGAKVLKRHGRGRRVELAVLSETPESLSDLDIREVRHVQPEGWIGNPRSHCLPCRGVEQQLHQSRRIENDHRVPRSARITSAALRLRCLTGRARSLSSTSWRVGWSKDFLISRSM
jgi:hypothetical protein